MLVFFPSITLTQWHLQRTLSFWRSRLFLCRQTLRPGSSLNSTPCHLWHSLYLYLLFQAPKSLILPIAIPDLGIFSVFHFSVNIWLMRHRLFGFIPSFTHSFMNAHINTHGWTLGCDTSDRDDLQQRKLRWWSLGTVFIFLMSLGYYRTVNNSISSYSDPARPPSKWDRFVSIYLISLSTVTGNYPSTIFLL